MTIIMIVILSLLVCFATAATYLIYNKLSDKSKQQDPIRDDKVTWWPDDDT